MRVDGITKLNAIHLRHIDIRDDQAKSVIRDQIKSCLSIGCFGYFEFQRRKNCLQ